MSKAFEICWALKEADVTGVNLARVFAEIAHSNQKRKYSGAPYIQHLDEVAEIIQCDNFDDTKTSEGKLCQTVAYLHDTIEDTDATREELKLLFGKECADAVVMLTDVSKLSDGNRSVRKGIDRAHLANASALAKSVKVADLLSNLASIPENEPFRKVFETEALMLLDVLKKCACDWPKKRCLCFRANYISEYYLEPLLKKHELLIKKVCPWRE